MPARRKLIETGTVLEICTRIRKGLPFTADPTAQTIIRGLLARAQRLNNITISHVVFMANHFHMIVVVQKPEDVSGFMNYFKGQSSKILNIIFGRGGENWAERYDSPRILDAETLEKRLVYLYCNPQQANLVETIDHYPNFSTWDLLVSGSTSRITDETRYPIETYLALPETRRACYPIMPEIDANETLSIDTAAALEVFGIVDPQDVADFHSRVIDTVRAKEKQLIRQRQEQGTRVIGKQALIGANPLKEHTPKKRQPRMICLGSCRKQRAAFIAWFKHYDDLCKEVYQQWKLGLKALFPAIGFPPRNPYCERACS
jgi:REP element-mobilizing transposase RayT